MVSAGFIFRPILQAARRADVRVLALLCALAGSALGAKAEDAEKGKQQFLTSCGVCHTAEPGAGNRQGPNLAGVYGRKVGSIADFNYSPALKSGTWVWNETTLDPWLTNSQEAHPGTFMNYRQANAEKRRLVIDYLSSLSKESK
ncbi:c-type cytochrome [Beijerinckia indica]|uniref:Cytochrome c class I n=1 Tax=Beijerinckia indica subsp. indica (strain ATCC 9039 / DSM 1715 / NCIMB 8712) TaxID=395963 RepID=B2ID00_BEII9|nr:c-type cytochrome [Beijerinckia indica]ACB96765.1 cytochrome c class I [Beijerinckia indica subsp. indica ATCC 9039]